MWESVTENVINSAEEFVPKVQKKKTPWLSDKPMAIEFANQRRQLKIEGAPKKDIDKMNSKFHDRLVKNKQDK